MNNLYDELRFNKSAAALLDHWMNLRTPGTACPHKKDFMPMKMGKYLPDVFMAEWVDDDHVIIRVAGSRTTDVTRRDTTGNNLMDNSIPGNKFVLQQFYRKMRTGQFAGVSQHRLSHAAHPTNAIGLQLPLLDADGKANFFVGIIKAKQIESNEPAFHIDGENSAGVIAVRYTNLSVQQAPMEIKLG